MNKLTIALLVCLSVFTVYAQDEKADFKPSGKPVVKVFANWHQGFAHDDDDLEDFSDDSGFEISRAVLGFQYQFSPRISSKVIVDMDDPGEGKLTEVAYLRNAYVAYNDDDISAYFGVIGMKQFKTQENNWGYRYIYKSAMDHYKFNNSVDAGLYVKGNLTDWLSLDMTLSNGDGAKSQQDAQGEYRMGYGLELKPLKGLTFRAYYDYFYESDVDVAQDDLQTLALFVGYTTDKFRVGAEFDMAENHKLNLGDDRDIYSVYGSYSFTDKFQAFARYDYLDAEFASASEEVMLFGCEYKVVKGVKISPNYRYEKSTDTEPIIEGSYVFLNFEYKF